MIAFFGMLPYTPTDDDNLLILLQELVDGAKVQGADVALAIEDVVKILSHILKTPIPEALLQDAMKIVFALTGTTLPALVQPA